MTDEAWAVKAASHTTGPHLLAAEAVLPYLHEPDVRGVIDLLADRFPGALPALDTAGPGFFDAQEQHDALGKVAARMHRHCPDPAQLADWRPGARVPASHTLAGLPEPLVAQLPRSCRQLVPAIAAQRLPRPMATGSASCACPDVRRHAPRPVPAVTAPSHGRILLLLCERAATRRTW
ncbi:hypothetical protein AB0420_08415 [Streptomyces caelestis]|uniref:Uncharacterized protein n=1 Tax=Streptomyces heliomycini TaxID=284032 RepID=A0ABV5LGD9_9ACTN|nr:MULTISPECIES: hypothetical protein [Streptomyces]